MANLAKLVVSLEAQSSKLVSELEKANNRAKKWENKTKTSIDSVKKAFIGLGIGIAAVKLKSFVTESVGYADNIAKMSDALGLTTKSFQQLQIGAELAGVEQSQFTSNMTAFVKRVGEARAETGPLVSFLKKYDEELLIAIQRSKSQEEALALMADAIQNAKTKTDEAALANAAFSRAGVTMVNFLRDGSEGLTEFNAKADELGLILDEKMVRNAEKADDQLTILSKTLKIQAVASVVQYADEIQSLVTTLIDFTRVAAEVPGFIKYIAESFAAAIHGPADPVRIADRIELLEKRLFSFNLTMFKMKEQGGKEGALHNLIFGKDGSELQAKIDATQKEIDVMRAKLELFTVKLPTKPAAIDKPEGAGPKAPGVDPIILTTYESQLQAQTDALGQSLLTQDEAIADAHARRSAMVVAAFENDIISAERAAELLLGVDKKYADEKTAIEQSAAAQILAMRANVANASIGFLELFADKNKAIAKVIIVIQKGLSIAQAIQNTAVAVTAALKYPPGMREAQIASIKAMGQIQVGLIAATGLAQLAGAGGGGGGGAPGIGSGGGTVSVDNPYTPTDQQAAPQTTIIFVGSERPSDAFVDQTITALGERINNGSTVIIRRDSPQAQEIAQAARGL